MTVLLFSIHEGWGSKGPIKEHSINLTSFSTSTLVVDDSSRRFFTSYFPLVDTYGRMLLGSDRQLHLFVYLFLLLFLPSLFLRSPSLSHYLHPLSLFLSILLESFFNDTQWDKCPLFLLFFHTFHIWPLTQQMTLLASLETEQGISNGWTKDGIRTDPFRF